MIVWKKYHLNFSSVVYSKFFNTLNLTFKYIEWYDLVKWCPIIMAYQYVYCCCS